MTGRRGRDLDGVWVPPAPWPLDAERSAAIRARAIRAAREARALPVPSPARRGHLSVVPDRPAAS